MKKIFNQLLMLVIVCFLCTPLHTVTSINDATDHYDAKADHDLIIAHLYFKGNIEEKDKKFMKRYNNDNDTFENAEKAQPFVKFIKINVERDQLQSIAKEYDIIPNIKNLPVLVLIKNGEKVAIRYIKLGNIRIQNVLAFINKSFKADIDKKIEIYKQIKNIQRLTRRDYYHYYPYYHYPFYYYHPYRRSGFSVGVGY